MSENLPELDDLDKKMQRFFPRKVVRKYYAASSPEFGSFPKFVSEYLISQYAEEDGTLREDARKEVLNELSLFKFEKRDKETLKSMAMELGSVDMIDHYEVWADIRRDKYFTHIHTLDLDSSVDRRLVRPSTYQALLRGGLWGKAKFQYLQHGDGAYLNMSEFDAYQTAGVILSKYRETRDKFTTEEWIDFLIRSIGFNPEGLIRRQKLFYLARIIPMVEQSTNSLELGPPGTGKSYAYENLSEFARMLVGGEITPAKLIYNQTNQHVGYVFTRDVLCFDEINKKNKHLKEIIPKLQQIMASNRVERGELDAITPVSLVFQGNINFKQDENGEIIPEDVDYLKILPPYMYDAAFLDRIHILLHGWKFPRIQDDQINKNLGLISNYFGHILHKLRKEDVSSAYTHRVEFYQIDGKNQRKGISIRDKIALDHTISGYIKLLYPNKQISEEELIEIVELAISFRQNVIDESVKIDDTLNRTLKYMIGGKERVSPDLIKETELAIEQIEAERADVTPNVEYYPSIPYVVVNDNNLIVKPLPFWILKKMVEFEAIHVENSYFHYNPSKCPDIKVEIEDSPPIRTGRKSNSINLFNQMVEDTDSIEKHYRILSTHIKKYTNFLNQIYERKILLTNIESNSEVVEILKIMEGIESTLTINSISSVRQVNNIIDQQIKLIQESRGMEPDLLGENYASILFDSKRFLIDLVVTIERWKSLENEIKIKFRPVAKRSNDLANEYLKGMEKESKIFDGEKFPFFAIDYNNILTSLKHKYEEYHEVKSPIQKLKELYFEKIPYYAYFFASQHLECYKKELPEDSYVKWYIETRRKGEYIKGEFMDIDSTLSAETSVFILQNHKQIEHFYLGSGDKDLHRVVTMAKDYGIPVTIIVTEYANLSNDLKELADDYEALY